MQSKDFVLTTEEMEYYYIFALFNTSENSSGGYNSQFPSLGIPRLELENPSWNTYVGHWNSYVGIPMSNVGIPTWVFHFCPDFCQI